MWYSEQITMSGDWTPVLTADRPAEKKAEGARVKIRNERKLPAALHGMSLDKLHRIFNSDFDATHLHVASGGLYRVTGRGRLEVTTDDAYSLVEYENEAGQQFAQLESRFDDGRFVSLLDTGK